MPPRNVRKTGDDNRRVRNQPEPTPEQRKLIDQGKAQKKATREAAKRRQK